MEWVWGEQRFKLRCGWQCGTRALNRAVVGMSIAGDTPHGLEVAGLAGARIGRADGWLVKGVQQLAVVGGSEVCVLPASPMGAGAVDRRNV